MYSASQDQCALKTITTEDTEDAENLIYQILCVLGFFTVVKLFDYEVCPRLIRFASN